MMLICHDNVKNNQTISNCCGFFELWNIYIILTSELQCGSGSRNRNSGTVGLYIRSQVLSESRPSWKAIILSLQGENKQMANTIDKLQATFFMTFSVKQASRYLAQQCQIMRVSYQNDICLSQRTEQFKRVILWFSSLGSGRAGDRSQDVLWLQCSRLTQEVRDYKIKSHRL